MCKTVKSQKPEFGVLDVSEKTEREKVLPGGVVFSRLPRKSWNHQATNASVSLDGQRAQVQTVSDLFTPYILWHSYMYGFKS